MMSKKSVAFYRDEAAELEQLTGRMTYLLTGVANALKGPPGQNMIHDWSDLPFIARALMKRAKRCTCGAFHTNPPKTKG
jgi:hypothetical protein